MRSNSIFTARTKVFLVVVCTAAILFTGDIGVRARADHPPPFLNAARGGIDSTDTSDPSVTRSRTVHVDFGLLGAVNPQDELTFNLFDNASFVGVFEKRVSRRSDSYTWFGRVGGAPVPHGLDSAAFLWQNRAITQSQSLGTFFGG